MIMGDHERIRLVILGGGRVGKTAIVKRFLLNTFSDKYRATVEDLHHKEYDFESITLKVDILDTSGNLEFPAMRRLSIATAHAFLLVYAVDNASSFDHIKMCFDEIREQRADFTEIPIVVVGNKIDLVDSRTLDSEEICDWVSTNLPNFRGKTTECSAKEDTHITDLFRSFLHLSKIPINDQETGLKRRSSAYTSKKKHTSPPAQKTPQFLTEDAAIRSKPRSRSLIRRSSRKAKQQVRDASGDPSGEHNCNVS